MHLLERAQAHHQLVELRPFESHADAALASWASGLSAGAAIAALTARSRSISTTCGFIARARMARGALALSTATPQPRCASTRDRLPSARRAWPAHCTALYSGASASTYRNDQHQDGAGDDDDALARLQRLNLSFELLHHAPAFWNRSRPSIFWSRGLVDLISPRMPHSLATCRMRSSTAVSSFGASTRKSVPSLLVIARFHVDIRVPASSPRSSMASVVSMPLVGPSATTCLPRTASTLAARLERIGHPAPRHGLLEHLGDLGVGAGFPRSCNGSTARSSCKRATAMNTGREWPRTARRERNIELGLGRVGTLQQIHRARS